MRSSENSSWSAKKISIEKGKIRVEFEKLPGSSDRPEKIHLKPQDGDGLEQEAPNATIEVFPVPGKDAFSNRNVTLAINKETSKIVWLQKKIWQVDSWENAFFSLDGFTDEGEDILKIPNGTFFFIRIEDKGRILITGGENAELSIADLKEFKNMGAAIEFTTKDWENWDSYSNSYEKQDEKANFFDLTNYSHSRNLSIQEAVDLLKEANKGKE